MAIEYNPYFIEPQIGFYPFSEKWNPYGN